MPLQPESSIHPDMYLALLREIERVLRSTYAATSMQTVRESIWGFRLVDGYG